MEHEAPLELGSLQDRSNSGCYVVPGGGIEPPTRGLSISLLIFAYCLRASQTVAQVAMMIGLFGLANRLTLSHSVACQRTAPVTPALPKRLLDSHAAHVRTAIRAMSAMRTNRAFAAPCMEVRSIEVYSRNDTSRTRREFDDRFVPHCRRSYARRDLLSHSIRFYAGQWRAK